MKKIAVITSGLLPMPALKDGAIEMLLQYTIDYNEKDKNFDFEVFSKYDKDALLVSSKYNNTHYKYIKVNKYINLIYTFILKVLRKLGFSDPNFQYFFIKKVYKKLKQERYDYIIVESENHFANYLLKRVDTPVILYLHNDKLNKNSRHSNYIINNAYHILVVSNYLKKQVLTLGDKYENKISVIHNGVKLSEFRCEKSDKYSDTINYLYVGRIEPNKGVLELIKAFNMLENKKTKLFIVGGSFHSSNRKTKYLKKVLKEASKRRQDIIFTGYIKHSELYKYYDMCDVSVVPSIWEEPAGLVNIEALASGVNLIVSNAGGIPEYINDKTVVVDKNNDFVNNLKDAMNGFKLKTDKKENKALDYFSDIEYCKRYFDTLKEIVR